MDKSSFKSQDYDLSNLTLSGKIRYFILCRVYVPAYKLGFRNIDKFLVFSSFTRDILKKDGFTMKPISFIPLGIELPNTRTTVKRKANTIVYVGRLEKFKGVMDLINAIPEVLKKIPNARLEIAGEGSAALELRQRVDQLGIKQSVSFKDRISQLSVAKLYSCASVVVMPSTWPEPFGKVGIEAMSRGTPVIATDVGGVRDWLHDRVNGFLVKPSDPSQLSRAIVKILSDTKLREKLSKNARKTGAGFTAEKFAQRLLGLIKETAGQG
jgi:glycosyltransferase involved in cell wall biosynthesis